MQGAILFNHSFPFPLFGFKNQMIQLIRAMNANLKFTGVYVARLSHNPTCVYGGHFIGSNVFNPIIPNWFFAGEQQCQWNEKE